MRSGRIGWVGLVLLLVAGNASAGGRWGFGLYIGRPYAYPYYRPAVIVRPAPIYVGPPPVIVQPAPLISVAQTLEPDYAAPAPATAPPTPPTLPAPTPLPTSAQTVSANADLEALNDPQPQTRVEAVLRLGRRKDIRAVRPLVRILQEDSSPQVREAAARALGLLGSAEALPGLQQAASADPEREVRKTASFAAEVIRASLRR